DSEIGMIFNFLRRLLPRNAGSARRLRASRRPAQTWQYLTRGQIIRDRETIERQLVETSQTNVRLRVTSTKMNPYGNRVEREHPSTFSSESHLRRISTVKIFCS